MRDPNDQQLRIVVFPRIAGKRKLLKAQRQKRELNSPGGLGN